MAKKNYDKAFKEQALKLSRERGSLLSVARELNIPYTTIHRWRKSSDTTMKGNASSSEEYNIQKFSSLLGNEALNMEVFWFVLKVIMG